MTKLTIGLEIAVMIFILLCTIACGGSDGSLAQGGINMIVVSGQAKSGGGNPLLVEGQEAVLTAGDQIMAAADGAGVKLLLVDGSLLYLNPNTELQVVTFLDDGTARLSLLKGELEVEAASPLLTVEISISVYEGFAEKKIQFTATPAVRDTTFQLWIDGINNAHLTVEAGEVNVTHDDGTETIYVGTEVIAAPGQKLAFVEPTTTAVPTADLGPAMTPDLTRPSPTATARLTVAEEEIYVYSPPRLSGPGDGDNFKSNDDILLMWDTPMPLAEDEWYEVQLWREGEVPYRAVQWVKERTWKVEPQYYPGRYQWRILIVRGQEGQKEILSPPSDTWRFGWLSPPVSVSTATTSPADREARVDLTVYLRGINNEPDFVARSGEKINAGTIYKERGTVYGDVAVRIGGTEYHFDKEPAPGEPMQLPAPYHLEVKFSDSLVAATTDGKPPGFDPQKAQFWVGELDCNSATQDKPYEIEMTLYAGGDLRKHTEVSFLVANDPFCGAGGPEDEEPEVKIPDPRE